MFGGKKTPALSRADALAMKPIRLVAEPMAVDEAGNGKLSVELQPPRIARWFAPGMKPRRKQFEFDPIGVEVWQAIDGKTSVEQIIRRLADHLQLDLRQSEASVVAFMKMLMQKGLVGIPAEPAEKKKQKE